MNSCGVTKPASIFPPPIMSTPFSRSYNSPEDAIKKNSVRDHLVCRASSSSEHCYAFCNIWVSREMCPLGGFSLRVNMCLVLDVQYCTLYTGSLFVRNMYIAIRYSFQLSSPRSVISVRNVTGWIFACEEMVNLSHCACLLSLW